MTESRNRVCLICGLLDSEGGCDHRDDCKRDAQVIDLRREVETTSTLQSDR
jgi:hypothetical protein